MSAAAGNGARDPFRHEALFYFEQDEFLAGTVPFIAEGAEAGQAVLVAVSPAKIELLRAELDWAEEVVEYADMLEFGRNPARIIPVWRKFVREHALRDQPVRGVGEPVWPGRTAAELVECSHHESLLNVAFADGPDWALLCPYDAGALDDEVLEAARRNHPWLAERGVRRRSDSYLAPEAAPDPFEEPLPAPRGDPTQVSFHNELNGLRTFVSNYALRAGLDETRAADIALAVSELAANSVKHAGGSGTLRIWTERTSLLCEVSDEGRIDEPLAGRERPRLDQVAGRGLWLVNQLSDLVQIRVSEAGNVIRLHVDLG